MVYKVTTLIMTFLKVYGALIWTFIVCIDKSEKTQKIMNWNVTLRVEKDLKNYELKWKLIFEKKKTNLKVKKIVLYYMWLYYLTEYWKLFFHLQIRDLFCL